MIFMCLLLSQKLVGWLATVLAGCTSQLEMTGRHAGFASQLQVTAWLASFATQLKVAARIANGFQRR